LPPSPSPTATETAAPLAVEIVQPVDDQLSLADAVAVVVRVPSSSGGALLEVRLDDQVIIQSVPVSGDEARVVTSAAPGSHRLEAVLQNNGDIASAEAVFETIALTNPGSCEILNNAECMLPYPSSRFLVPADTPTGWRIEFPEAGMPQQFGRPIPPAPYGQLDGFSPTVQILMHFAGGVDAERSNAARLLPATRTYDARSLDADSPTVLLDVSADPPQRVLHFVENDARATSVDRQVLFLRPGKSLTPGHRYVVAARNLVTAGGTVVQAEPVFAALRDRRPTDIAAVEARREHFENLFAALASAGLGRDDLILAFDFVVQSDAGLTDQMLSMRDQSFDWLAAQAGQTFTVERIIENDCAVPGTTQWRQVEGTYQVPLFLSSDPVTAPTVTGTLRVDAAGVPVMDGLTHPPFTIGIPCTVLADGGTPALPVVLGHGLFGDGRGFVAAVANLAEFTYIAGATDWRGLSTPDISGADLPATFIGRVILNLSNFSALPDRLRQGQLNTLMLARMMKSGAFNTDAAFQTPEGVGVFAGEDGEQFYIGGSLGGIMGLMFAALSPDVRNVDVIVPAINFSILLQRATPFVTFQGALELTGVGDAMKQAVLLGVIHELWVRGESAGYATHITGNPLPRTNAKRVLMTAAYLDQQVSNQGTEIAARTLGLPSLVGSLQTDLVDIPDVEGPLDSAYIMYDTGSFALDNPAHQPFIPPLVNLQAQSNRCDPHGLQARIPAAVEQLRTFLQPGGQVVNYCNGRCDAGEPDELPDGRDTPCDPLS
jgi:hypothetical protein